MNLHEHQAKELLSSYGVPIQRGMVVENIDQLQSISQEVKKNTGSEWLIVKAQIHACLLYTSPSPRDLSTSRMPSSA